MQFQCCLEFDNLSPVSIVIYKRLIVKRRSLHAPHHSAFLAFVMAPVPPSESVRLLILMRDFTNMLVAGSVDVVLSWCHCTLVDSTLLAKMPEFESQGLGVISASPLAMGLLTQKVG